MAAYVARDLAFAEVAPIIIDATATVAGTRAEVWEVLCDHERWTEWMASVKECRPTSSPASGVGSTRTVVLAGGISFSEEFIAWDEPSVWAFTGLAGPPAFRSLVERVTLEALDADTTRVIYRMAVDPRPGFGFVIRAARGTIAKNLTQGLENLDGVVADRRG